MGSESGLPPENDAEPTVVSQRLNEALSSRFLSYAMSTITARALPDVRDGLKPVHRRVLHAMRQMKLDPKSGPKKCAKVIGEVMGNFHPHGDSAIYEALVRLAQDFSVRYPLVFGQGNFGNIDGDGAAAMRYTEAKLTEIAQKLMEGIGEDAVDFRPTYDGEDLEPVVLPAGYPNLLANGAAGIAVGMATNIPPHNAAELIDLCLLLIESDHLPNLDELLAVMPGPDLPTGGVINESKENIRSAYETGRGSFRLRAVWHEEKEGRQKKVIVTEIPFQVQKTRLIERIADLMEQKKLPLLGDIRDESTEEIRLVLEPKNSAVDPNMMMESLFRLCDLETRIPLNMNVLVDRGRVPKILGLDAVLEEYLLHRQEVLLRRSQWRLEKIARRLHLLEALLIVYLNLDEVIRIIREEEHPKIELMKRFSLSDEQAETILDTRLRSLRKLEEMALKKEKTELLKEQKSLKKLIANEQLQWQKIASDLRETRKLFDPETALGRRRTRFAPPPLDIDIAPEAFVEREPISVILSQRGWVRAMRGHKLEIDKIKFKEGDKLLLCREALTTDRLTLIGSSGRVYSLPANRLPSGRGAGEPLRLLLDMDENEEIVSLHPFDPKRSYLLISTGGRGFLLNEETAQASKRSGKHVMNLGADEELCFAKIVTGKHLAIVGEDRKLLILGKDEIPEMTKGKGVKLKGGRDGQIRDAKFFDAAEGLFWTTRAGRRYEISNWRDWLGKRAQAGKIVPPGFPKSGKFG